MLSSRGNLNVLEPFIFVLNCLRAHSISIWYYKFDFFHSIPCQFQIYVWILFVSMEEHASIEH